MLWNLPPELRAQIYDHLVLPNPLAHPVNSLALTSVSHRPPPLSSLLVCRVLTQELLSHYYHNATFKLVLSHAFNFYRVDPALDSLNRHAILQRIRNIELVFFCDGVLVRDFPSFGPDRACKEVGRRAERAVEVLRNAPALKKVTVSWVDPGGHWGTRAEVVSPVRALLKGGIAVEVGDVLGIEDAAREDLILALKVELDCENIVFHEMRPDPHPIYPYQRKDSMVGEVENVPPMMAQKDEPELSSLVEYGSANTGLPVVAFAEKIVRPVSPSPRY